MSLYKDWTDMVIDYVKREGEEAFWSEYGAIEKQVYTKILGNHGKKMSGKVETLAGEYGVDTIFYMGFLDGVNDSLEVPLDLESVEKDTDIDITINFEKLYFNMLDAKADYLYELPQWEGIFSKDKRKEIHTAWKDSKTVVNKNKVGRNDPCPCGSGKKYKQCCGKN